MGNRTRVVIGSLAALAMTGAQLAAGLGAAGESGPGSPSDRARVASARLVGEATGGLGLDRDAAGVVVFAGLRADERVENPAVSPTMTVRAAASAHLQRYGAAFGVAEGTLSPARATRTVSGQDAVRFTQSVDGVPVIGGETVVSLRPDRQLASMQATLSRLSRVASPIVTRAGAARTARAAGAKATGSPAAALQVNSAGRWVFDPAVFGAPSRLGARTVWRTEVSRGPGVRRLMLVDDQTGAVVLDLDLIQDVDRVVCDRTNLVAEAAPCVSGFARTENGQVSGVPQVNNAFTLSGAVSDFYQQIGGIDLTAALGIDVGGGTRKLASTVRFCGPGSACPYANAFWNGAQMYYGDGFEAADDVVGHEMTHGVIDQNAALFYAYQSGAINESIADIMGEIVDHRNQSPGDTAGDWRIGEDLPIGAIRDLEDPRDHGQPDRIRSDLYTADPGFADRGGVHTNSGVGNKTAYLISQGGSFNGRDVTGIDGADPLLTKTAGLYLEVLQSLSSGSDYADLARVLDQSCQDLLAAGTLGFTTDDCVNVHTATLATELSMTPGAAAQPADARATCPAGTLKRALFDSETGTPTAKFSRGSTWLRAPASGYGPNATSGRTSWFSRSPAATTTSSLVAATGIRLPAGQSSYLWFQHWRRLDFSDGDFYDGGTVEVDDLGTAAGPVSAAALAWVNGPIQTLHAPHAGLRAFGGDSLGYLASRVALTPYAGKVVKPRFTMRTDSSIAYDGWYLDDIRIYTCGATFSAPRSVSATGGLGRARVTWTPPATDAASVTAYRVSQLGGPTRTVSRSARSLTVTGLKPGRSYRFAVRGVSAAGPLGPVASVTATGTRLSLTVKRSGSSTKLSGRLSNPAGTGLPGRALKVQRLNGGTWATVALSTSGPGGAFSRTLSGTSVKPLRVVFAGGLRLIGSVSPARHL